MSRAKLVSLELERFKSYAESTRFDFAPLTVIIGRNNSGKSTIIQALLLLKQTLEHARGEVPLHLEGFVEALSIRELTYGWPPSDADVPGPRIALTWDSRVDLERAFASTRKPEVANLRKNTGMDWLPDDLTGSFDTRTTLVLHFAETDGRTRLDAIDLLAEPLFSPLPAFLRRHNVHTCEIRRRGRDFEASWRGHPTPDLDVEFDHFIPYLQIDPTALAPRDRQRAWHAGFLILFAQPLEDLGYLLRHFSYLGSMRGVQPSLFRPVSVAPAEIGASGEFAAQILHARRSDKVSYLPAIEFDADHEVMAAKIRARSLVDAVNEVMLSLGIETPIHIEDIKDVGFRLLFGGASLQHVGRGLTYLLPILELGLLADPMGDLSTEVDGLPLEQYLEAIAYYPHIALEELEAHTHPKVQSRLAHWLVALAMAGRYLIVETHSDHLVRRLRGLVARAHAGGSLETWLLGNVAILEVEQHDGRSAARRSQLKQDGGLTEKWPVDFMDESRDEERAIYYASLDKSSAERPDTPQLDAIHDEGPEPE